MSKKKIGNDDVFGRRMKIANDCMDDMIEWLQRGGGQVGIYDGNNITEERRNELSDKLVAMGIHVNSMQLRKDEQDGANII